MKPLLALLIFITAFSTKLPAQESLVPMRLTPVEVENVDASDVNSDRAGGEVAAPLDVPNTDVIPSTTNSAPAEAADPTPQLDRLEKLNRPMSLFRIEGLTTATGVSPSGFTGEAERWITASEISESDSLRSQTTYTRRRLYFEDRTLERCGYSDCVTSNGILINAHSAAKFFVDTALLPYRIVRMRPDELVGASAE